MVAEMINIIHFESEWVSNEKYNTISRIKYPRSNLLSISTHLLLLNNSKLHKEWKIRDIRQDWRTNFIGNIYTVFRSSILNNYFTAQIHCHRLILILLPSGKQKIYTKSDNEKHYN